MKIVKPHLAVIAAGIGVIAALAADARGETASLELKKLKSSNRMVAADSESLGERLCQYTYPQYFNEQISLGANRIDFPGVKEREESFKNLVTKEPKFESEHPFRGIAKFGSQQYPFVLDYVPEKPKEEAKAEAKDQDSKDKDAKENEAKSDAEKPAAKADDGEAKKDAEKPKPKKIQFNRLYIDLNHNGDLTDDKPVEAEPMPGVVFPANYSNFNFPRVELTIDVDGTPVEYAFRVNGYASGSSEMAHVGVQFNAAAYREGDIELDGKKHHVMLVDFNSNGRFDDELTVSPQQNPEGRLNCQQGDHLLIDPDLKKYDSPYEPVSSSFRSNVSKLVKIEDRFFDVKITPAGDKITLTASSVPLGNVTNKNGSYAAIIYGDRGIVKIAGEKNAPCPVPEGEWKLLSYSLKIKPAEPEKPADEEKKEEKKDEKKDQKSLADALKGLLGGDGKAKAAREATVEANASGGYQPVKVAAGETAEMPFGPPYKPVVACYPSGDNSVYLILRLVGSIGEECSDMSIGGGRPPKPEFTITDPDGKNVQSGNFEYG